MGRREVSPARPGGILRGADRVGCPLGRWGHGERWFPDGSFHVLLEFLVCCQCHRSRNTAHGAQSILKHLLNWPLTEHLPGSQVARGTLPCGSVPAAVPRASGDSRTGPLYPLLPPPPPECFWFVPTGARLQDQSRRSSVSLPRGKGARRQQVPVSRAGGWMVALSVLASGKLPLVTGRWVWTFSETR